MTQTVGYMQGLDAPNTPPYTITYTQWGYCPHCGNYLAPDWKFCPLCGRTRVASWTFVPPSLPAQPEPCLVEEYFKQHPNEHWAMISCPCPKCSPRMC